MSNLLMINADRTLAAGKRSAFYYTLEGLSKHFGRIDVICRHSPQRRYDMSLFGNVYIHPSPWPYALQWFWIRLRGARLARQHHYGVMTVQEHPLAFLGIGARWLHRITHIPYILEIHHIVGYPRAGGFHERIGQWLSRLVIPFTAKEATAVRVVNATQAPHWLQKIGVAHDKIVVIPSLYIDLKTFHPNHAPKQYDLIFVGRLARNKGLSLFLDVVRRTGLTALVVGDGPLRLWATRRASRLRLRMNFHGYARDAREVASLMSSARLLVMTSLNEGGPRVVVEALACGVPVVATPVGVVPDILPPECVEEWNGADIATKATNLLTDQELYRRVQEAGIFVAHQFEKTAAMKVYADKLKELAE